MLFCSPGQATLAINLASDPDNRFRRNRDSEHSRSMAEYVVLRFPRKLILRRQGDSVGIHRHRPQQTTDRISLPSTGTQIQPRAYNQNKLSTPVPSSRSAEQIFGIDPYSALADRIDLRDFIVHSITMTEPVVLRMMGFSKRAHDEIVFALTPWMDNGQLPGLTLRRNGDSAGIHGHCAQQLLRRLANAAPTRPATFPKGVKVIGFSQSIVIRCELTARLRAQAQAENESVPSLQSRLGSRKHDEVASIRGLKPRICCLARGPPGYLRRRSAAPVHVHRAQHLNSMSGLSPHASKLEDLAAHEGNRDKLVETPSHPPEHVDDHDQETTAVNGRRHGLAQVSGIDQSAAVSEFRLANEFCRRRPEARQSPAAEVPQITRIIGMATTGGDASRREAR
ncbi:hypothetical protein FB451DRAFT_1184172 [Mycena latifolia]|nr:hypothetical protein FB451DRAFT_1184172 [Mycena latifolia]